MEFVAALVIFKRHEPRRDDKAAPRAASQFDGFLPPVSIQTPREQRAGPICQNPKAGAFCTGEMPVSLCEISLVKESLGERKSIRQQQPDSPENLAPRCGSVSLRRCTEPAVTRTRAAGPRGDARDRCCMGANAVWLREAFQLLRALRVAAAAISSPRPTRFERLSRGGPGERAATSVLHRRPGSVTRHRNPSWKRRGAGRREAGSFSGRRDDHLLCRQAHRSGVFGGGDRRRQIENFTCVDVHGFLRRIGRALMSIRAMRRCSVHGKRSSTRTGFARRR